MAAELDQSFGTTTELIAGGGGIFDISLNGTLVFSKHASGRFPETTEIVEAIRNRLRQPGG